MISRNWATNGHMGAVRSAAPTFPFSLEHRPDSFSHRARAGETSRAGASYKPNAEFRRLVDEMWRNKVKFTVGTVRR
jgi:hypothetical protein